MTNKPVEEPKGALEHVTDAMIQISIALVAVVGALTVAWKLIQWALKP